MTANRLKAASVVALAASLAACSANHNSIYRARALSGTEPVLTTIDAKQRAILSTPDNVAMRVCAEPSPDVFSVLAQAASASGSFGQSADPKAIEAAASLAGSSAETGSTIPRTQTINMLREAMFRTCERYLNGSLTALEFPIQAVRDQRMMIATMAIEQLTGAVTPRPVIIGAAGSATAGASSQDAVARIDQAQKAVQTADADVKAKQAAQSELKASCDPVRAKVTAGTALTDAEKTTQKKCDDADAAVTAAQATQKSAASHYDALKKVALDGGPPVSTTTTLLAEADGGVARAHSDAVKDVAAAVQDIVRQNYKQDEFLLFCLKVLTPGEQKNIVGAAQIPVQTTCTEYVRAGIDAERQELLLEQARASGELDFVRGDEFGRFWSQVAIAPGAVTADPAKLAAKIDAYITAMGGSVSRPERYALLKTLTARSAIEPVFRRLPDSARKALAS